MPHHDQIPTIKNDKSLQTDTSAQTGRSAQTDRFAQSGKTRVAAYCRVSSDHEHNLLSLENQIQSAIDLIPSNRNWVLFGIYTDQGVTGTSIEKRSGFKRLLDHCEAGYVDLIITKSVSRFSRNTEQLLSVLRKLRALNIDVIFEKEGLRLSKMDDDFILTMYVAVAQKEAINVSKNSDWAHEKRALLGKPYFPRMFGYNISKGPEGQIVTINEQEAQGVREIFSLFLKGVSLQKIGHFLSANGYRTIQNQIVWTPASIKHILMNIRYTGTAVSKGSPSLLGDLRHDRTERALITIENHHPPIISRRIFDQAAAQISPAKKYVRTKPVSRYIYSKRVICGHCGKMYQYNNKPNRPILRCATSRENASLCIATPIPKNALDQLLMSAFFKRYDPKTPEAITVLIQTLRESTSIESIESSRLNQIITLADLTKKLYFSPGDLETIRQREYLMTAMAAFEKFSDRAVMDSPLRKRAIQYLEGFKNTGLPPSSAADDTFLDLLPAFAPFLTLFSGSELSVQWLDGSVSSVGDCIPHVTPAMTAVQQLPSSKKGMNPKEPPAVQPNKDSVSTPERVVIPYNEKAVLANRGLLVSNQINMDTEHPLRVCAYCRTSKKEEAHLSSIALQVSYFTHLIMTQQNWIFSGIYADHGVSGTQAHSRSEFTRMLDDARSGKFDIILVKSVSRFSRNTVDTLKYVRELRDLPNPVSVFFENEGISTQTSQGELMLSLYASIAQEEVLSNSEAVLKTRASRLENGTMRYGGRLPFGYQLDSDGSWKIQPEQADIVRRIFEETAAGHPARTVANKLNSEGISTPGSSKAWGANSIYRTLANDDYLGSLRFHKNYIKDPISQRIVPNRGERNQYIYEEHHPAIISNTLWKNAQTSLSSRRKPRTSATNKPFRKKFNHYFNCGLCGAPLTTGGGIINGKPNHYLKCSASIELKYNYHCDAKWIREEVVETAFMELLYQLKEEPQWQPRALSFIQKMKLSRSEEHEMQLLVSQLNDIYREIHDAVRIGYESLVKDLPRITDLTEKSLQVKKKIDVFEDKKKKADDLVPLLSQIEKTIALLPDFKWSCYRPVFDTNLFLKMITFPSTIYSDRIHFNTVWGEEFIIKIRSHKIYKRPLYNP